MSGQVYHWIFGAHNKPTGREFSPTFSPNIGRTRVSSEELTSVKIVTQK